MTPKDSLPRGQRKGAATGPALLEWRTPCEIGIQGYPERHILWLSRLGRLIRRFAHLLGVIEADEVEEAHRGQPTEQNFEEQVRGTGGQAGKVMLLDTIADIPEHQPIESDREPARPGIPHPHEADLDDEA